MMSNHRYPIEEIARRGDEIYNRTIRAAVEGKHDGEVVAIDVDTGFYALGDSVQSAVAPVQAENSEAEVWFVRVGRHAVTRIRYWKNRAAKKAVMERIDHFEERITKGREFLENGKHAHWHGFRPLFAEKVRDGKALPPHKDWVKNVFLRRYEKALGRERKTLARLI
jgi:hypothetical protein